MFIPPKNFIVCSFINTWQKLLPFNYFSFQALIHIYLCQFLTESMKASGCHTFTIPSQRCSTTYVQLPKNSDQNVAMATFSLHFSSFTLFNNHNMNYNCKTISHIYFKFGVNIRIHTENILLSKMTFNSHFYKTLQ